MSHRRRNIAQESRVRKYQANRHDVSLGGELNTYLSFLGATTDDRIRELHKLHNELNEFHQLRLIMKPDNMLARLDSIERRFLKL